MTNISINSAEAIETATANMSAMVTAQTEQAITMAKASFEQLATQSRDAMAQNLKTVDVITEMTRGNFDALLESSRIASGGFQTIVHEVAEHSKQALTRTAAAAQALAQAKSAPELMQLQSAFAQAEFSTAIAGVSKLSQEMFTMMTAIFEPLQKQAVISAQIKDVLHTG